MSTFLRCFKFVKGTWENKWVWSVVSLHLCNILYSSISPSTRCSNSPLYKFLFFILILKRKSISFRYLCIVVYLKNIKDYIVTIENKNMKITNSVGPTIFQQSMHDSISSSIHHLTFVSFFLLLSFVIILSSCVMFWPFNISSFFKKTINISSLKDFLAVLKS